MSNPYHAPQYNFAGPQPSREVQAPAIALIVVSSIALVIGSLSLIADVFFLLSGFVDQLEANNRGPISEHVQIAVRMGWGILLIVASAFVLYGAIKMKNLRDYGIARAAAIVAMIPMLGPCCILGIPFGIWALVVLLKPEVRQSFS